MNSKTHWNKVYADKTADRVTWYQAKPQQSLDMIAATGVPVDGPIIDVGGGASLLVDRLCEQGYTDISILDVSASAIAHVRDRLADRAGDVRMYEADVTAFEPQRRFVLWHDRAVFHFLTSEKDRDRYVRVLERALRPGGHLIIMTFAVDGPQKCSGLDIVQYDAEKIKSVLGTSFDLAQTGHETHITPAGNQQKFAWFRFTRTPEKD